MKLIIDTECRQRLLTQFSLAPRTLFDALNYVSNSEVARRVRRQIINFENYKYNITYGTNDIGSK